MLWPLLATRPFQWWRLSALRNVRFFRFGSEAAKHEVQSSGGLIITEVRYVKQVLVRCRVGSRHYDYICHLYFRIKFRQKMRIELVAKFQPRPRQEPHSLVISHESLSRALREDPFEFFVGMRPRRGLKLESCFGLVGYHMGYQTLSIMAPVCA